MNRKIIALCLTLGGLLVTIAKLSSEIQPTLVSPLGKESNQASIQPVCQISASFTPEIKHWEPEICRWSEEHDIDPDLIATVMQIESCGNDQAISSTGVRGLFQVTGANLDVENPFDPNVSMAKGPGKVLKYELDQADGNITAAMAGYNGGPLARQWIRGQITASQYQSRLPRGVRNSKLNEVKWYAQWANIFYEAKNGKRDTLQKWLDMGGSHLCSQASIKLGLTQPAAPVVSSAEVSKG